jgi:DNA-binding SARP family transcriptional activator
VEFGVLGPLEVRDDGRAVPVAGGKPRTLLALLLLNDGRVVPAERLIDELWGDDPPATAATALQVYVSKLRKTLGHDVIRTQPPGYAVSAEALDVREFERLCEEARAVDAAHAAPLLRRALELWRGDALCDAELPREAARLEERRLAAFERWADAELELGHAAELVPELERLVAREPLRESFRAQLMLALYGSGRQADALDAYRDARRTLIEELGLEPGERLQRVEQAILRRDGSLRSLSVQTTTATAVFIDVGVRGEVDEVVPRALDVATIALAGAERVEPGLGDALVAVFASADDAVAGAAAAIEQLVGELGDSVGPRAGLATAELTLDARVSGPAVVLAARRVRDAAPGEVAAGDRTAAAARSHRFERRGDAHVLVS